MTNRDRIVVLLERYADVLPGLVDTEGSRGRASGYALLASGPWKHSSYRRLETLLAQMRREESRLWRHLIRRYLHFHEVRRASCAKCGLHPPAHVGRVHSHPPGRAVTLVPIVARFAPEDVSEAVVEAGIDWLESRWPGEVDLPHELVSGAHAVTCVTLAAHHSFAPAQNQEGTPETRGRAGQDAARKAPTDPGPAPSVVSREVGR